MKRATVILEGRSPYSQSRHFDSIMVPPLERESKDAYDQRTWRHHIHADPPSMNHDKSTESIVSAHNARQVYIPGMAVKNCLTDGVKFLGEKVPEKRGATWTKHYNSGIMVVENLYIHDPARVRVKTDDKGIKHWDWKDSAITVGSVDSERLYMNADGKKGGSSRVWRTYPIFHAWIGKLSIFVLDELIVRSVFVPHLDAAGKFIGLGRFRPQNGGFYGRFRVLDCAWEPYNEGVNIEAPQDEREAA